MERINLNKTLRLAIILIGNFILELFLLYTFFWRMLIYSDIPPSPSRSDIVELGNLILICIVLFNFNLLFMIFTKNRE
ncbi:hypothetical protein [Clostridium sp. UBA1652]|uniref:hypothetical protein n=1 Tax=Clostridium sp. UBA1652 TaxID=1946348 RepID=UPI002580A9E0|nr:hypothetical protein [Clostridium sp. UBA1652]